MKAMLLYCCCTCLLFTHCSTPHEIFATEEFENNNRSSDIRHHFDKEFRVQFLGYQSYRDSVITAASGDSALNWGIISNKVSVTKIKMEKQMLFGNDTVKCHIHYLSHSEFTTTSPPLIDIFNLGKTYTPPPDSKTELSHAQAAGTIQYPGIDSPFIFAYENFTGYLVAGKDSFKLSPVAQGKWKPMQTIIGMQLAKGDTVYGAIHTFTGLARKKVFLYTKATALEQFLTAAYFAVIASIL